jgi:fumarate hydratase subunit alpha
MLTPSEGKEGIKRFVLETVKKAGGKACPPIVVGVGIGGTMDKAALLSKKALLRPLGKHNPKKNIAGLEKNLLKEINKLGIGPQGLGGKTTALAVNVETFPTHIAGLPVAVNICCYLLRWGERVL